MAFQSSELLIQVFDVSEHATQFHMTASQNDPKSVFVFFSEDPLEIKSKQRNRVGFLAMKKPCFPYWFYRDISGTK